MIINVFIMFLYFLHPFLSSYFCIHSQECPPYLSLTPHLGKLVHLIPYPSVLDQLKQL